MTVRPSLGILRFAALASLVAACTTPTSGGGAIDEGNPAEEPEVLEEELSDTCTYSRKWFASLKDRACEPVPGRRGTWVPSPLFDANDLSTCTYTWSGEKYSRADQDALKSSVDYSEGLTPACGSGRNPLEGELVPIPNIDNVGMAGSAGCDVCGILRAADRLDVVLPPEKIVLRQLQVPLTNGEYRAFQLQVPSGARAVSFTLPEPPEGTQYVTSKVTVW